MKTKIEWAEYWHSLGFSVVPVHYNTQSGCSCAAGADCASPGKHPAPASWMKYQTRRADKETLEFWFGGRFANHNIGVVTGSVSNNVFAVDVDIGDGKDGPETLHDLVMNNDDLPLTLEQRTGSGGKHYFFKAQDDQKIITGKNTLGVGIDTRGEGGFVVVAPSNHKSGGEYAISLDEPIEAAPEWLTELTLQENFHHNGDNQINQSVTNMWGDVVDGREAYMVQLLLGTLRTWWAEKGKLPTLEQLIEDAWPIYEYKVASRSTSLDDDQRGRKLFEQRANYQLKRAERGQLRILNEIEAGSEIPDAALPVAAEGRERNGLPTASPTLNISDWGMDRYAGPAPEMEFLIDNILPVRVPGLLAAVGGLGKSYILLDLCMKVAGGDQSLHKEQALGGTILKNGKVVFLGAEDSADSIHRRIESIAGPNLAERAAGNLFVVPLPDAGGPVPLIQNAMGQYTVTPQYLNIRQQLIDLGDVALVVIDPLQAFAHADINTDPAAGQFWWTLMSELCVATNSNVLIAHHMRKEGTFSIRKSAQAREAIRGTTALVDGARWVYGLWAMPENDEIIIAQKLDFDSGQGQCVMGGIVKINDAADKSTRTFIRSEQGLLIDRTNEVAEILEASTKLSRMQTDTILDEIDKRWGTDEPFSHAVNTSRSLQKWISQEYAMPKHAAKQYVQAWLDQKIIENVVHNKQSKAKGLRMIRKLDDD